MRPILSELWLIRAGFKISGSQVQLRQNLRKNFFELFDMTPTLLIAVMIIYTLDTCSGAIDTGVTVFGTTVGPNYKRPEGIRR